MKNQYLNNIKLLQKCKVNPGTEQKDGEYVKKNIHFSFLMSQIVQEALHKPFAFFDLHFIFFKCVRFGEIKLTDPHRQSVKNLTIFLA